MQGSNPRRRWGTRLAVVTAVACAWSGVAFGQTRTWLGATDSSWATATNWSGGAAPTSSNPVVFDNTATTLSPSITTAAGSAKGITVLDPSGVITASITNNLNIAGGIDMSAATRDLQLGSVFTSGTVFVNTTGTVAVAAGRTLTIGARVFNFSGGAAVANTIEGPGTITATGTGGVTVGAPLTMRSGSFTSSYQMLVNQPLTLQGGYLGMISNDSNNFIVGNSGTAASYTQTSGTSFFSRFQVRSAPVTISGGTAWLGALQLANVANNVTSLTVAGNASVSGTWGSNFAAGSNAVANIYLSGGTLALNQMPPGIGTGATRSITFDGGVLSPQSGTGATLVQNMTNAWVTNNGAIIDTAGFNASITQALINGTAAGTAGPLTKRGAGTLTLTGVSTFSGTTTIAGGKLLLSGTGNLANSARTVINGTNAELAWASSATLPGPIDVTAGTLSGTGTLGGLVSVLSGGILSAGTATGAPGTLTANAGLALNTASVLNFNLNAADTTVGGGINDLIVVGGNFTLGGSLNVTGTGDFSTVADNTQWRLFNYSGGSFTGNSVTLGTMPSLAAGKSFQVDTATPGQVNLVVIPEPTTATISVVASAGLAALILKGRRRST